MSNVSLIDGHIDDKKEMTKEKAIRMIDEYLTEPHSVNKEWVECLTLCKQAVIDSDRQKAEIERLKKHSKEVAENCTFVMREHEKATNKRFLEAIDIVKAEAIKEFAERLKESAFDCDVSFGFGKECYTEAVAVVEIDNVLKEMVGD